MKSEQMQLKKNINKGESSIKNTNHNTKDNIIQSSSYNVSDIKLPLDVSKDLNTFSKICISKEFDYYRTIHCFESPISDFIVYGELPDGDRKVLFTVRQHYECCNFCDGCSITCCMCCTYVICDAIIFQLDYKRNNECFYTQGVNLQKGCYCCKCLCSCPCCLPPILYLRENTEPDNKDFDFGVKKGKTTGAGSCCLSCKDRVVTYTSQEGNTGHSVRLACCDLLKHSLTCCFGHCFDIEMDIEDGKGAKVGRIYIPNGWCSKKVEGKCCYLPRAHYEIELPKSVSSFEKFQIIADVIHFEMENSILFSLI